MLILLENKLVSFKWFPLFLFLFLYIYILYQRVLAKENRSKEAGNKENEKKPALLQFIVFIPHLFPSPLSLKPFIFILFSVPFFSVSIFIFIFILLFHSLCRLTATKTIYFSLPAANNSQLPTNLRANHRLRNTIGLEGEKERIKQILHFHFHFNMQTRLTNNKDKKRKLD